MKQIPNTQTVLALQMEEGAEAMEGTGATNGSGSVPSSFPKPESFLWKTYVNVNP